MGKGYLILTEDVHDPDGMAVYAAAATPLLSEFGGRVLVADDQVEVAEGTWHGTRTVVAEFESLDAARKYYWSDAYQKAVALRQAAADCNLVITSGLPD
jgi:uncharacterized protein (DUF1330 family)